MNIIDVNCAVGAPLKSHRFTTAEGLLQWMDTYGIQSALTYHTEANREPEYGNEKMLELRRSHPRLRACLAVDPALESLGIPGQGTALQRLQAARPSALRAFPDGQNYPFTPFYAAPILELCQQLRLPLILSKTYDNFFLDQLPRICQAFPDVPLILPRFGLKQSRQYFPILEKLPNVYLDMSIMVDTGSIEAICSRFGSQHLLFGSGMPTFEPSGALGLLCYAQISQEDKENIAHGNFERLEKQIQY